MTVRMAVVFSLGLLSRLLAGIPEPDAILYGTATVNGVPAHQQEAVVLVARLASGQEIGRFDFADCNADGVRDVCERSCSNPGCTGVTGCGTARDNSPADGLLDDCPGNLYALKVRCESTPDGVPPSGTAAVLNPSNPAIVRILMQTGSGPEKFVRNLLISERGKIQRIALSVLNLFAFRDFTSCRSGPGGSSPGGSCTAELFTASDYDEDGDVDLRDLAFLQNEFVGG
ncbi:MAG: hypothetical protein AABZ47_04530 [Planctomycetota bacterium]